MTTPLLKGARFERQVRDHLVAYGWVVFRSAGSRGPVDLVVMQHGRCFLIQCKSDGRLRPAEKQALQVIQVRVGLPIFIASRGDRDMRFQELMSDGSLKESRSLW